VTTKATRNGWLVAQTWLITRLMMALVGAWVAISSKDSLATVVTRWDVAHFLTIASQGYTNANSVAFFPGWPALIWATSSPFGILPALTATVLALIASGVAAAALYRMYGAPAAIAWLLAPAAVFTMVPYSESIFCAAAFWAWERAQAKHWGVAAVLAAVASTTRVSGLFLVVALAILALTQSGRRSHRAQRLAWLLIPVATLAGYLLYLRLSLGSWSAWYDAQANGWARGFTWPWISLQHTLEAIVPGSYYDQAGWSMMFRFELVSMAVGILITVISLVRKRWGEAAWVGSQVAAFSTSYWFMSVNRAVLLWFPLWELIGKLGVSKRKLPLWRRGTIATLVLVALGVQSWWAYQFFAGAWSS
jgi:hypothetical protein